MLTVMVGSAVLLELQHRNRWARELLRSAIRQAGDFNQMFVLKRVHTSPPVRILRTDAEARSNDVSSNKVLSNDEENMPTKRCPYCAEVIASAAIVCRYCGHDVRVIPGTISEVKVDATVTHPPLGGQRSQTNASTSGRRLLQIVLSLLAMPFCLMSAVYLWIGWTARNDGLPLEYVISQFIMMFIFLAIGGVIAWIAGKVNPLT